MQGIEGVNGSPIRAWQVIFFIPLVTESATVFDEPDQETCQQVLDALIAALEQQKVVEMAYTKANFRPGSEREGSVYAVMNAEDITIRAVRDGLDGRFLTAFENQTTESRRDDTTFHMVFDGTIETQVILHSWGDTILNTKTIRCVNAGQNKIIQGAEIVADTMNGVWQVAFNVH